MPSFIATDADTPKLEWWFLNPANELEKNRSKASDGAFFVLSASVALYERYLVKLRPGLDFDKPGVRAAVAAPDLKMTPDDFDAFWDCFRNGLQHQFQPKRKSGGKWVYSWAISSDFVAVPSVMWSPNKKHCFIQVNPWEFARLVKDRFDQNPTFFEAADSHKAGEVQPLESDPLAAGLAGVDLGALSTNPLGLAPKNAQTPDYQKWTAQTGLMNPNFGSKPPGS